MIRLLCILSLVILTGCAAYDRTGWWTPDGFNLTQYHALGTPYRDDTVAWGPSWTLKDH